MTSVKDTIKDIDIPQEDLDKLDADLLEIETLYRSRCVQAQQGTNVVVREIPDKGKDS